MKIYLVDLADANYGLVCSDDFNIEEFQHEFILPEYIGDCIDFVSIDHLFDCPYNMEGRVFIGTCDESRILAEEINDASL